MGLETVTHRGRTTAYRQTGRVGEAHGRISGADDGRISGDDDGRISGDDDGRIAGTDDDGRIAGTDDDGRVSGTDDTVLYVHGSGSTHRLWVHQYGPDRPRPAAALDLSGHGESADVDVSGREAIEAYADDVVAVARESGAGVLAGNSLGGAVVLQVTLERDFEPEALVFADTGARLPVHPDLLEYLDGEFDRAIEFLHRPDFLFHDPEPEWVERTTAALRETGRAVTERDFRVCNAFDARDRLGEVDVPALVVYGEHDHLTPPEWNEYLAAHLPEADLVDIADAAHLPMVERPEAFNSTLAAFLDRL